MKFCLKNRGLELAVIAFCAWRAADLLDAWRHSPYDQWGWLSFLIWVIPAIFGLFNPITTSGNSTGFTIIALGATVAGRLSDLNFLSYFALAISMAGFVPSGARRIFWLVGALAWMPALGWLANGFSAYLVLAIRLLLAMAAICPWLLARQRTSCPS